jgi:hypothetical protein
MGGAPAASLLHLLPQLIYCALQLCRLLQRRRLLAFNRATLAFQPLNGSLGIDSSSLGSSVGLCRLSAQLLHQLSLCRHIS